MANSSQIEALDKLIWNILLYRLYKIFELILNLEGSWHLYTGVFISSHMMTDPVVHLPNKVSVFLRRILDLVLSFSMPIKTASIIGIITPQIECTICSCNVKLRIAPWSVIFLCPSPAQIMLYFCVSSSNYTNLGLLLKMTRLILINWHWKYFQFRRRGVSPH